MNTYFYDVHFSIQTLSYTLVKYRVVIKISDSIKHAYLNIWTPSRAYLNTTYVRASVDQ